MTERGSESGAPKQPRPKALISWSSGKDSAFALHQVRLAGEFDVVGALTTVSEAFDRVSIHGVRQEILRAQCEAAGLPLRIVPIPYPCPNEIYEARMAEAALRRIGALRDEPAAPTQKQRRRTAPAKSPGPSN
jgi:diphthamide synthase (EF-2-diphthine--ammonia ligase)